MEVDPVNEETPTQGAKIATLAVTTTATVPSTAKRFVLKRRLQNGSASSPSNGSNGEASNGGPLMPQLVSTATGAPAAVTSTPGVTQLTPRGPSGGLKIRKIEP